MKSPSLQDNVVNMILSAAFWFGLLVLGYAVGGTLSDLSFIFWLSMTAGTLLRIAMAVLLETRWAQKTVEKGQIMMAWANRQHRRILDLIFLVVTLTVSWICVVLFSSGGEVGKIFAFVLLTLIFSRDAMAFWTTFRIS